MKKMAGNIANSIMGFCYWHRIIRNLCWFLNGTSPQIEVGLGPSLLDFMNIVLLMKWIGVGFFIK